MPLIADGQVDRVVRIIGTSTDSWEAAARNAIAEAAKSIEDLRVARVTEQDIVVRSGTPQFRVKVELAFQLDRNRVDSRGIGVRVRRILVVANKTLAGRQLEALIKARIAESPTEFHVLVPEPSPTAVYVDPATGLTDPATQRAHADSRSWAREQAEARLSTFRSLVDDLAATMTGEVALGDPLMATHRVMQRATFDEIIVSTLPAGVSRWLKLDLPTRLERAFDVRVTRIVQQP